MAFIKLKKKIKINKLTQLIFSGVIAIALTATVFADTTSNANYNPDAYITKNVEDYIGTPNDSAIDFYPKYPKIEIKPGMDKALIEKGEYLVKIGDCMACHTDTTNHGQPFAGGLAINTPFGTFYTPNITPDKETGIGNWTDKDFIRAMHDGINPQGQYYFPVFPYTSFNKVSDADLLAIKAYLNTVPPVHKVNKETTAPWPFSWRFSQLFWRTLFFKAEYYKYNPAKSPEWNRGAYLVQGLGHCGECHTPRNLMGAMKQKYYLTGAFVDGFWAPDITNLGLDTATVQEITDVFKKNQLINDAGPVRGPMAEVNHDSLQYLTPSDLQAIAIYLKSLNSPQPRVPAITKQHQLDLTPYNAPGGKKYNFNEAVLSVGKKVYTKTCSICHDAGMAGAPQIYNTANWSVRLQQGLPTLYKHAIDGFNQMPPKGACVTCTDDEVKAAVDYIVDNSQVTSEKNVVEGKTVLKPDTSIAYGKKVYLKSCAACHNDGLNGAPKLGDPAILKHNVDVLIQNTLDGIGAMPPKGGCSSCTKADIVAAVKYMAQQADPKNDYSLW